MTPSNNTTGSGPSQPRTSPRRALGLHANPAASPTSRPPARSQPASPFVAPIPTPVPEHLTPTQRLEWRCYEWIRLLYQHHHQISSHPDTFTRDDGGGGSSSNAQEEAQQKAFQLIRDSICALVHDVQVMADTPDAIRLAKILYLLLDETHLQRITHSEEEGDDQDVAEDPQHTYAQKKNRVSQLYLLTHFFQSDFIPPKYKNNDAWIQNFVDLKTAIFLSEVYCGRNINGKLKQYSKGTLKPLIDELFEVEAVLEIPGLGDQDKKALVELVSFRATMLYEVTNKGRITEDIFSWESLEFNMIDFLGYVFNSLQNPLPRLTMHQKDASPSAVAIRSPRSGMKRGRKATARPANAEAPEPQTLEERIRACIPYREKRLAVPEAQLNDIGMENQFMRRKNFWTQTETEALEEGMRKYGIDWAKICEKYGRKGTGVLSHRTNVNLKDRARAIRRALHDHGFTQEDMGVWGQASI